MARPGAKEDAYVNTQRLEAKRKFVDIPGGRISYVQGGQGPVALFVHGVLLNGHLWRHQLAALADVRTCIALDLPGHGETTVDPGREVSSAANARLIGQFLEALAIDRVDLVGNDSG